MKYLPSFLSVNSSDVLLPVQSQNATILSLYLPIHNPLRHISQNMFLYLPAARLRHLTKTHLLIAKPKNMSWGLMPSQNFPDPRSELFVRRFVYTAGSC